MNPSKFMAMILLVFLLLMFGSCGLMLAHGATRQSKSALGTVQEYTNPNVYLYGAIIDGTILGPERNFTNVRFQPSHSFLFYSETILFCGDQSEPFRFMRGPIVVTYKRVAHKSYQGVACHDFVSIDHVQSQDDPDTY